MSKELEPLKLGIRKATQKEMESMGWGEHNSCAVLELPDSSIIIAGCDIELNAPGSLNWLKVNGDLFTLEGDEL